MNLIQLAVAIFDTAESNGVEHMAVGAIAAGTYGIPRATKDIDLLVSLDAMNGIWKLIPALEEFIEFESQAQFDTITWGRRHVGVSRTPPPFKVELFEMFSDPFVESEFSRRQRRFVPLLNREIWLPTAEDIIVQKIRWGRPKDLDDARDILAVQGPETLDMPYIDNWCSIHGTSGRLRDILASLPEL
jgi:hypothetical protein